MFSFLFDCIIIVIEMTNWGFYNSVEAYKRKETFVNSLAVTDGKKKRPQHVMKKIRSEWSDK